MYITCPKCSTSFVVTADQIGESGRKVRCSKCKNTWRAMLPAAYKSQSLNPDSDILKTPESGIHLPVLSPLVKRKKSTPALYALFALFIMAIVMIFTVNGVDLSKIISFHNQDLKISEVKLYQLSPNEILARYKIANHNSKPSAIPYVRIRLYDHANKLLDTRRISLDNTVLEPNESLNIKIPLEDIEPGVHSIDLSPCRWWDFF